MTRPRLGLVGNPVSGGPTTVPLDAVRERLSASFDVDLHETSTERGAEACARDALAAGAAVLVAAGGDGTVGAVAGVLAGSDVPLGIVPRGTGNSVARALDVPLDLEGAARVIEAGATRRLDVGRCGGRRFVLHCVVGVHADAVADTPRAGKQRWGALAYAASTLKKLAGLAPFRVELDTGHDVLRCSAVSVAIANLAPRQTLVAQGPPEVAGDDARLDVTVLAPSGLSDAVAIALHLLASARRGEAAKREGVGWFRCRSLRVTAEPPQTVLLDGEPFGTTPVDVEVSSDAVRVLAPPAERAAAVHDADLDGLPDLEVERRGGPTSCGPGRRRGGWPGRVPADRLPRLTGRARAEPPAAGARPAAASPRAAGSTATGRGCRRPTRSRPTA
jgi:YegS/Rv2252/BmrU family lipid kinase